MHMVFDGQADHIPFYLNHIWTSCPIIVSDSNVPTCRYFFSGLTSAGVKKHSISNKGPPMK